MWAENAGFAAAALWNDWQAAGIVIYGWEMKANVERYYIRTILSDRIGDTQAGSKGKTGGDIALYHLAVFLQKLLRLYCGGGVFGSGDSTVPCTFSVYGQGDEGNSLSVDNYCGI